MVIAKKKFWNVLYHISFLVKNHDGISILETLEIKGFSKLFYFHEAEIESQPFQKTKILGAGHAQQLISGVPITHK